MKFRKTKIKLLTSLFNRDTIRESGDIMGDFEPLLLFLPINLRLTEILGYIITTGGKGHGS